MLRLIANTKDLEESMRFCHFCERRLSRRFAWLELDQRIDAYHDLAGVPEDKSQGWFPFGLTCARRLKEEALVRLYPVQTEKAERNGRSER